MRTYFRGPGENEGGNPRKGTQEFKSRLLLRGHCKGTGCDANVVVLECPGLERQQNS